MTLETRYTLMCDGEMSGPGGSGALCRGAIYIADVCFERNYPCAVCGHLIAYRIPSMSWDAEFGIYCENFFNVLAEEEWDPEAERLAA